MHPGLQARSIHREDGRLKEGGLIMRRTLVLLATMTLVVVASGSLAVAASSLNNGNFETGNLTGWSVDTPSGGNASAVTSFEYCPPTWWGCGPEGGLGNTYTTDPHEGSYFALLTSGYQQPEATRISQPFEASNGDKVSGWAFFQTENYLNSCTGAEDEKGQVVITSDSGAMVATPFEQSIYTVDPPQYGGNSGWRYWEYTFTGLTGTAQFRIEARVQNAGPSAYDPSRMGLDDVKTSTGGGPDLTSPETYITSGYGHVSSGVACITDSTSNTFEFNSNEQGSTFKCQLSKDDAVVQAWADCTSPKSYSNLSRAEQWETLYKLEVKATDPAGDVDPTPASRYWFVKRGTATQPPPQPPPDTTAPKVDSVFPKEDITGVARTTNVTATFSEAMDASSISGQSFKLFKKGSTTQIAATVSYDSMTRTATLSPFDSTTTRLARGTTYKAVVTTGATDMAGNQLDQNPTLDGLQQMTWFFTTTT
jgi:hypothetical protein